RHRRGHRDRRSPRNSSQQGNTIYERRNKEGTGDPGPYFALFGRYVYRGQTSFVASVLRRVIKTRLLPAARARKATMATASVSTPVNGRVSGVVDGVEVGAT